MCTSKKNWGYIEHVQAEDWEPLSKRIFSYYINEYKLGPKPTDSKEKPAESKLTESSHLRFELSRARTETALTSSKVTTKTKRLMSLNIGKRMFDPETNVLVDAKLSLLGPHIVLIELLLQRKEYWSKSDPRGQTGSDLVIASAILVLSGMHDLSIEQTQSLIEPTLNDDDKRARLYELPEIAAPDRGKPETKLEYFEKAHRIFEAAKETILVQFESKHRLKIMAGEISTNMSQIMSESRQDLNSILRFSSTLKLGYSDKLKKDYGNYEIVDYSIDRDILKPKQQNPLEQQKQENLPNKLLLTLLVRPPNGNKSQQELLVVEHERNTWERTIILESLTQIHLMQASDLQSHGMYFASSLNMCLQVLSFNADVTFKLKPHSEEFKHYPNPLYLYLAKLDPDRHATDQPSVMEYGALRILVLIAYPVLPTDLMQLLDEHKSSTSVPENCEIITTMPRAHMLALPVPVQSAEAYTMAAEILPSPGTPNYFTVCLKGSTSVVQFKIDLVQELPNIDEGLFNSDQDDDEIRLPNPEDMVPLPKIVFLNSKCDVKYPIKHVFVYKNSATKDKTDAVDEMPEQKNLADVCIVCPEAMRYHISYKLKQKPIDWNNLERFVQPFQELPAAMQTGPNAAPEPTTALHPTTAAP